MSDVLIVQTNDGGEIKFEQSGDVTLTDDLRSSVYISMFGGGDWWADIDEPDSNNHLTGEAGQFIKRNSPNSTNLERLQDSAMRDLQWLLNIRAASRIAVTATLRNINRLTLIVDLEYDGRQAELKYSLNWTNADGSTSNANN